MEDSDEKEQCDAFRYIIGQDGRDVTKSKLSQNLVKYSGCIKSDQFL